MIRSSLKRACLEISLFFLKRPTFYLAWLEERASIINEEENCKKQTSQQLIFVEFSSSVYLGSSSTRSRSFCFSQCHVIIVFALNRSFNYYIQEPWIEGTKVSKNLVKL